MSEKRFTISYWKETINLFDISQISTEFADGPKIVVSWCPDPRPASGYEIRTRINQAYGHFHRASPGGIYPAVAALLARGHIEISDQSGSAVEKRIYKLTDLGMAEFRKVLNSAIGTEDLRSEFLAAMYFSDLLIYRKFTV